MEIIQITDLHITDDIENIKNNCRPYHTLSKTLEHIKENYNNINDIVITGDLSNDYTIKSYSNIKELLKRYKFNVYLLPGNHDESKLIKLLCDDQISIDCIDLSKFKTMVYNFDTHLPCKVHGYLKELEIKQFEKTISANLDLNNIIVFTHHPIIEISSKWIDKHKCVNSELLIDIMLSHKNKKFKIFSGHVHQEFNYINNNIEFFTTPSTCYQFRPNSDNFALDSNLSYGYRVISLHDNNISTKVLRI